MKKYKLLMLTTIFVCASGLDAAVQHEPTSNPQNPLTNRATELAQDLTKGRDEFIGQLIEQLTDSSNHTEEMTKFCLKIQAENVGLKQTSAAKDAEIDRLKSEQASLENNQKTSQDDLIKHLQSLGMKQGEQEKYAAALHRAKEVLARSKEVLNPKNEPQNEPQIASQNAAKNTSNKK